MNIRPVKAAELERESPPFLRTWRRVYAVVLCYTFSLIAVLYVLSRIFTVQ